MTGKLGKYENEEKSLAKKNHTRINELLKNKLSTPIDLTIFPNINTLDFGKA